MGCKPKSKELLHMERDLEFLDNTRDINESLSDSIFVEKIGFLRDKENQNRFVIIKVKNLPSNTYFTANELTIKTAFFINDSLQKEVWGLKPKYFSYKGMKYLYCEFSTKSIKELKSTQLSIKGVSNSNKTITLLPIIINND